MARRIWATVKPHARRQEVKEAGDGNYIISVRAVAREGKANEALIELLAGYFAVPKSSIKIIHGQSGRRKLVEIG